MINLIVGTQQLICVCHLKEVVSINAYTMYPFQNFNLQPKVLHQNMIMSRWLNQDGLTTNYFNLSPQSRSTYFDCFKVKQCTPFRISIYRKSTTPEHDYKSRLTKTALLSISFCHLEVGVSILTTSIQSYVSRSEFQSTEKLLQQNMIIKTIERIALLIFLQLPGLN